MDYRNKSYLSDCQLDKEVCEMDFDELYEIFIDTSYGDLLMSHDTNGDTNEPGDDCQYESYVIAGDIYEIRKNDNAGWCGIWIVEPDEESYDDDECEYTDSEWLEYKNSLI